MAASALRNPLPVWGLYVPGREPSDTRRSRDPWRTGFVRARGLGFACSMIAATAAACGAAADVPKKAKNPLAQGPALLEERGADAVRAATILGC